MSRCGKASRLGRRLEFDALKRKQVLQFPRSRLGPRQFYSQPALTPITFTCRASHCTSRARRYLRRRCAENFEGADRRRVAAFDAELWKQVAEVTLHSGLHRSEQNRDVAVALALGYPKEDFGFPFR